MRPPQANRAAEALSLAAAPSFALMAIMTTAIGSAQDATCMAMHAPAPLSGMALMYLLMSAFHLAPWLRLMSLRRSREHAKPTR